MFSLIFPSLLTESTSAGRQESGPLNNSAQHRPIIPVAEDNKFSMTVFKGKNDPQGHPRGELGFSQTKSVDESRAYMATVLDKADKDLASN